MFFAPNYINSYHSFTSSLKISWWNNYVLCIYKPLFQFRANPERITGSDGQNQPLAAWLRCNPTPVAYCNRWSFGGRYATTLHALLLVALILARNPQARTFYEENRKTSRYRKTTCNPWELLFCPTYFHFSMFRMPYAKIMGVGWLFPPDKSGNFFGTLNRHLSVVGVTISHTFVCVNTFFLNFLQSRFWPPYMGFEVVLSIA